jgi:hypothetical protein
VSQLDRHLTTEQLSTLLDNSLSSEEEYEATDVLNDTSHLKNCTLCQHELAELRQTVTLLRALPPPQLPRSFALPVSITQTPVPTPASPKVLPIALRSVSGLAAAIGIIFILSGLLSSIPFLSQAVSSIGRSNNTAMPIATAPTQDTGLDKHGQLVTPPTTNTKGARNGEQAQNSPDGGQPNNQQATSPEATPTPTPEIKAAPSTQHIPRSIASSEISVLLSSMFSEPEVHIGLGILLFLLGSIGLRYFKPPEKLTEQT